MDNSELRTLLSTVESKIVAVSSSATTDDGRARVAELEASFAALVKNIGLGPAPELRKCPKCGNSGMRHATVCGHCWTKLAPLEA